MNLYFRLIWLLLTLPWLPKQVDPLAQTTLTMHVMPNDLDVYGHVNNGRYLSIMDLGRLHLMAVTGLLKIIQKNKWAPLLGSVKIHFLKPLKVFQRFTMTTQTLYWDEKWIYLEQKIYRDEKLCAVALMKILFIRKNGKISPDDFLHALPNVPAKPDIPLAVKYWIEAEQAGKKEDL
jgi:acyl-CoA thioesterase FadM